MEAWIEKRGEIKHHRKGSNPRQLRNHETGGDVRRRARSEIAPHPQMPDQAAASDLPDLYAWMEAGWGIRPRVSPHLKIMRRGVGKPEKIPSDPGRTTDRLSQIHRKPMRILQLDACAPFVGDAWVTRVSFGAMPC